MPTTPGRLLPGDMVRLNRKRHARQWAYIWRTNDECDDSHVATFNKVDVGTVVGSTLDGAKPLPMVPVIVLGAFGWVFKRDLMRVK